MAAPAPVSTYRLQMTGEFTFADLGPDRATNGFRTVLVGPQHPGVQRGLPMDFPSVGHGQNDLFAWQARAFLGQVAGVGVLPPVPSLAEGLHNMQLLAAITESALDGGRAVAIS